MLVVLPVLVCLTALAVVIAVRSPDGAGSAGSAGSTGSASRQPDASSPASSAAQEAARWLSDQPPSGAVAVDPSLWADVAGTSALASRLVPVPSDGAATGSTTTGSAGSTGSTGGAAPQWILAGPDLRASAVPGSWAAQALAASRTVVVFGDGDDRVEVREMTGDGASAGDQPSSAAPPSSSPPSSPTATPAAPRATATAASPESLQELLANPRLEFSSQARKALADRPVDLRLASLLVQLAAQQPLSVSDLPGEEAGTGSGTEEPVRTAVLDGIAGRPVGADAAALQGLQRQLSAQDTAFRASATQEQDGATATLRLVLPPAGS